MKNLIPLYRAVLLFVCCVFCGCFNPLGDNESEGTISVSLPGGGSPSGMNKTVLNNKNALRYEITFTGPGGRSLSLAGRVGETVSARVIPGQWTVSVRGVDPSGATQAIGEAYNIAIKSGQENRVDIKMAVYTEVRTWQELADALSAGSDDDFIVVKQSFDAEGAITLDSLPARKITIVAERENIVIEKSPDFSAANSSLFNIYSGYTLELGSKNPKYKPLTIVFPANTGERVINVGSGGFFTLHTGTINGNNVASYDGDGVYIAANGTFTMNSGRISGNHDGFGVQIESGGIFKMLNGVISKNLGGIYNEGEFKMSGGTISENEIGILNENAFTMTSGEISGNAGGVLNGSNMTNSCEFIMNGGTISENTGIGVDNYPTGTFTMKSGHILKNTNTGGGGMDIGAGGVWNDGGIFTMSGGEISGNTFIQSDGVTRIGGGVYNIWHLDNDVWIPNFFMSGSAYINENNPVILYGDPGNSVHYITVTGPLARNPAATITFSDGTQIVAENDFNNMQVINDEAGGQTGKFRIYGVSGSVSIDNGGNLRIIQ